MPLLSCQDVIQYFLVIILNSVLCTYASIILTCNDLLIKKKTYNKFVNWMNTVKYLLLQKFFNSLAKRVWNLSKRPFWFSCSQRILIFLVIKYVQRTKWRLLQKRVVGSRLDIYVFRSRKITYMYSKTTNTVLYVKATQGNLKMWPLWEVALNIQFKIICTIH